MYCRNCGQPIDDNATVCQNCGAYQNKNPNVEDNGGIGWGLLGCCIPVAGLVLFLVWKDTKTKTAIGNPYVHMIAHPTGRIVGERGGYNPDVALLIEWAAQHGKILELNANPYRLDLCIEHLQLAMEHNVPIAINTDAHAIEQLRFMDIGVKYAQKAWLKKDLIVNTWSKAQFENFTTKNK